MSAIKTSLLFKISFIIPLLLLIVGPITMYYYQFYLFSEKFRENGLYFGIGFVIMILLLFAIPFYLFKKRILKKSLKRILCTLELLLTVGGIIIIIGGLSLSSLFIGTDHYNVGPILTWGTEQDPATEMTVMWRTSENEPSIVYYGLSANNLSLEAQIDGEVEWHQVTIDNLTPNTTYYYRVEGLSNKNIHSFKTAPIGEQNFSFMVFSDTRQNTSPLNIALTKNYPKWMMQTMISQGILNFINKENSWMERKLIRDCITQKSHRKPHRKTLLLKDRGV